MPKKVAFHSYMLSLHGTEVATYDFARFNEEVLGNESVFILPEQMRGAAHCEDSVLEHFSSRCPLHRYEGDVYQQEGRDNLDRLLEKLGVDALYRHELYLDGKWACRAAKNLVHATFRFVQPSGDVFAVVSDYLARVRNVPAVPLVVSLPTHDEDMREELGIPKDARVFGRHGGAFNFNLRFVHDAIRDAVDAQDDLYFLFLNTAPFMAEHPRVIHLPGTPDLHQKVRFINSCDAMIHARCAGESFGLAVSEFSACNKPVVSWDCGADRAHIEHFGDRAFYYHDRADLMDLFRNFEPDPQGRWTHVAERFTPEKVMARFNEVFLQ